MTIAELQGVIENLSRLETLVNSKLTYIIENIYSVYKPDLVPLSDGTVKSGAIDTGEMARKSKFTVDFDPSNPTRMNFILDTTEYFKFVDGRNDAVPNGTNTIAPREFLSILLSDPEVDELISETFGLLIVSIFESDGTDLIQDEELGFDIIGNVI